MVISVVGMTEKRPFIYTLLKLCQSLGDTCLITNKRHYKRLIENYENEGSYQNIQIYITDATVDDVYEEIGHEKSDFDFWIFENDPDPESDLILYVKGFNTSEDEELILDALDNYKTVNFGFGKKDTIKYATKMFENCEMIEATQQLVEVHPAITKVVVESLAPFVKLSPKLLAKKVALK